MKLWPAALAFVLIICGCASNTPLHEAARKGDKAKVAELLQQGAKVNAKNARGCTPLFIAADNGDTATVQELLDHGANPTEGAFLKHGNTPLHVAAQNGFNEVIELLLAKSTNANLRNSAGQTPLMLAAWARHPQTVTLLIKHGARPGAVDHHGWTALHTPWDAKPADADYTSVMEILIVNQAPVNAVAGVPLGYTPLMGAAMVGDKETVELLLDHGAKVNSADSEGQTAYSIAEHQKYFDVLATLSERGGTRFNPITREQAPTEPAPQELAPETENP
jgi:ankyrin repeat protein